MAKAPADLEPYLPTLEKLRTAGGEVKARLWWRLGAEVDLLTRQPDEMVSIAAILVSARVVRRERTTLALEVAPSRVRGLPESEPRHEPADIGRIRYVIRAMVHGPHPCRCYQGRLTCAICRGLTPDECPTCEGLGTEPCATCEGSGECVTVDAVSLQDQEHELVYAYLPNVPVPLEHKLQAHFEADLAGRRHYPNALAVQLDGRTDGGPYRQVSRDLTSFHGYALGGAMVATVRTALEHLRGEEPLSESIGVWARPILWLRYHAWGARREVAVISEPGEVRAFVTDGGLG